MAKPKPPTRVHFDRLLIEHGWAPYLVPTVEAAQRLGFERPQSLTDRIPELQIGIHYIDVSPPGAKRKTYRWDVVKLREFFSTPAECRIVR